MQFIFSYYYYRRLLEDFFFSAKFKFERGRCFFLFTSRYQTWLVCFSDVWRGGSPILIDGDPFKIKQWELGPTAGVFWTGHITTHWWVTVSPRCQSNFWCFEVKKDNISYLKNIGLPSYVIFVYGKFEGLRSNPTPVNDVMEMPCLINTPKLIFLDRLIIV